MDHQAQFIASQSTGPRTAGNYAGGEPLERDGRGVQGKPLPRADFPKRPQFLETHASPQGQEHAQHKKDEPEVPRHPAMKPRSEAPRNFSPRLRVRAASYQRNRHRIAIMVNESNEVNS
jgi:hypothetical protein